MELRHLRYFIRAAELMNFTKAAESLYVSQPTLSVQIHQLEEELGTELFTRSGRNVRLTESGKVFLARALQAVRELEEGALEIDAIKGILRGNLCVASLPLYGSQILTGWVSAFNAIHPNVCVSVRAIPSEDIEIGILAGTIDLGLTFLPTAHSELNTRDLFRDEIVLVVAKNHRIARKKSLSVDDFVKMDLALPSERMSATRILTRYFEDLKLGSNIIRRMSFDDGHALIEFVKHGKFATFLPRGGVENDPNVAFFELPPPGMPITVGAIWTHLSPSAKVFLQVMTEESKNLKCSASR